MTEPSESQPEKPQEQREADTSYNEMHQVSDKSFLQKRVKIIGLSQK